MHTLAKRTLVSLIMNLSTWMTDLPEKVTDVPINQLAIPGSHNSGVYYLDPNSHIAANQPSIVRALGACAKQTLINWSLTQRSTISEQLHSGVRYFDFRTGYLEAEDDFFIVHGLYGHRSLHLLEQISHFITTRPKEVIILDFLQFQSFTDILHDRYAMNIKKIFAKNIYACAETCVTSTLKEIWKTENQIIIRYNDSQVTGNFREFWPVNVISRPWPNTNSGKSMLNYLNNRLKTSHVTQLNVFQGIFSPQTPDIVSSLLFNSKTLYLFDKERRHTVNAWLLELLNKRMTGVNIFLSDFALEDNRTEMIVSLNMLHDTD